MAERAQNRANIYIAMYINVYRVFVFVTNDNLGTGRVRERLTVPNGAEQKPTGCPGDAHSQPRSGFEMGLTTRHS